MAQSGRPQKCDPKVDKLWMNIKYDEFDIAKQTLKEFGIDAEDGDRRTALINSVIENKTEFIYWLIEKGADINHQDKIGYSVLHYAGQNKLVDIAKYLLEKGANPNLQDLHGNTPLWTAIFNAKLPTDEQGVVKLLIKFGANPDIVNNHGRTPRIIYQTMHNKDISTIDLSN